MKRMVDGILRQYGTELELQHGQERISLRGFLQSVLSKGWQSMVTEATPLGEAPRGTYVYIGPAGQPVSEGDVLTLGQREYYVRRVEPCYYGSEQVYTWGLCVEKGVSVSWDSQS